MVEICFEGPDGAEKKECEDDELFINYETRALTFPNEYGESKCVPLERVYSWTWDEDITEPDQSSLLHKASSIVS